VAVTPPARGIRSRRSFPGPTLLAYAWTLSVEACEATRSPLRRASMVGSTPARQRKRDSSQCPCCLGAVGRSPGKGFPEA
jgi:hypothetical protein